MAPHAGLSGNFMVRVSDGCALALRSMSVAPSQRFGAVIRLRPACSYVESNQGEVIGSNQRIF